jgi:hypothetical protein
MTMFISTFISKVIGEKGQWRQYKARTRQLPASYRTAVEALERYLMYFGTGGGGTAIYEDLIDLFEQSAASGPRSARSSEKTPWSSSRSSSGTIRRASGSSGSGNG